MHQILLPIGIEGEWSKNQFAEYCAKFDCQLKNKKKGDSHWTIASDDTVNFFWLGMNLNFKYNNGISISTASLIEANEGFN